MTKDRVTGLIALILGLIVTVATSQIPVSNMAGDVGPRVFPYLISLMLVICGTGLVITGKEKPLKPYFTRVQLQRLGLISGSILLYFILLTVIGFIIATLLGGFALCMMFGKKKQLAWWKALIFTVLLTTSIYVVFTVLFSIQLPTGMFF